MKQSVNILRDGIRQASYYYGVFVRISNTDGEAPLCTPFHNSAPIFSVGTLRSISGRGRKST